MYFTSRRVENIELYKILLEASPDRQFCLFLPGTFTLDLYFSSGKSEVMYWNLSSYMSNFSPDCLTFLTPLRMLMYSVFFVSTYTFISANCRIFSWQTCVVDFQVLKNVGFKTTLTFITMELVCLKNHVNFAINPSSRTHNI